MMMMMIDNVVAIHWGNVDYKDDDEDRRGTRLSFWCCTNTETTMVMLMMMMVLVVYVDHDQQHPSDIKAPVRL